MKKTVRKTARFSRQKWNAKASVKAKKAKHDAKPAVKKRLAKHNKKPAVKARKAEWAEENKDRRAELYAANPDAQNKAKLRKDKWKKKQPEKKDKA